ncbi:MAG: succinate dehydrogenase assembly factor 2 [candidate division WOR-3 bacterium]|nr:succinate dehydrogenase assembly factor 2 [candidate division WOR-3 bacterium]
MELMYGDYNDDTIQVQNLRKKAKFLILYRGTKEAEELLKKFYLDEIDNMTKEELIELIEFLEKDDFTILEKLIK